MATESRLNGRVESTDGHAIARPDKAYFRRDAGEAERRTLSFTSGLRDELARARTTAEGLESRARSRCRVSQVQTTRWGVISSADEVLGMILQRPSKAAVGLAFASLIAGPERRVFAERARMLLDSKDGIEWETRLLAPGARIGVPVGISVERGPENSLRWYIRDLTELRRAQARVMELEQMLEAC